MGDKMTKLKPCPFCGGEAFYWLDTSYDDKHVIECESCGTDMRDEYEKDDAIEKWNTRHIPEGYAVVPVNPTEAIIKAGQLNEDRAIAILYKAMIKAAQETGK